MKMLPRIPKATDFWGFSAAGRANQSSGDAMYDYYRVQKLSFGGRKDRSKMVYNARITLENIPSEAYDYQVNGKSALEWILDRYQVTTNSDSQIVNDPNDYSREIGDPRYIIDLIKRLVAVSLETVRIVSELPLFRLPDEIDDAA